jgi:hypothetical protein
MENHFFTLTDEEGRTARIIKASTNNELESALMDCIREHLVADDSRLDHSLLINDFIGAYKTFKVDCYFEELTEDVYNETYEMRVESCVVYKETKPVQVYQVLNQSGNPASSEQNEEAIFLSEEKAEEYIRGFLYGVYGLDDMKFHIVPLT